jgi:RimJ/RimL family protein N-acetyltransferase
VTIELRPLTHADVAAHRAGEDEQTVRWLTDGYGNPEGTAAYFDSLADNARVGKGKRGFGVWLDDRLAGYVDCEPSHGDGLEPGDVNLAYAVHPWARGRSVAVEAVRLICEFVRAQGLGATAAVKVEPGNVASVRVAEKCGFIYRRDVETLREDGTPVTYRVYARPL